MYRVLWGHVGASDDTTHHRPDCLQIIESASGLVVKFNVAIVEPPVRFRACAFFATSIFFSQLLGGIY